MSQRSQGGRACIQQTSDPHSGSASYLAHLLQVIMLTEKSPDSGMLPLAMDDFIESKVGQRNL